MSDAIELYNADRGSDPFASFRFKAKAMFAKPISRDEFTSMQAQLSRIEEKLQDIKLDNSHISTEIQAVHSIAVDIGNRTYTAMAALEKNIAAIELKIDLLGSKEIIITPSSVNITGGKNSKATITASQAANPAAIFVAISLNPSIVEVSPAPIGPSTPPNSFLLTEKSAGFAVIAITDNAAPPNTASVSVTAS